MHTFKWHEKNRPISQWWNSPRTGVPLWLIGAAILVYWSFRIPPPGFAVGALAVVAGIMSIRDMKVSGKIVWTVLRICLLITEFHAIDKDRADNAAELKKQRKEQDDNFEAVLRTQNSDFAATAKSLEEAYTQNQNQFGSTMGGISRQIDIFTGGKSYAYLTYVPGQGFLAFIHKGEDRIFSTYARITDMDDPDKDLWGTVVEVGELSKGKAADTPVPPKLNRPLDKVDLNIFFTARNGDWTERFRARRTKDGWMRAFRVEGAFGKMPKFVTLCETVDKGFPVETLDKDFTQTPLNPTVPRCDR
jgi:hypothetical protein